MKDIENSTESELKTRTTVDYNDIVQIALPG